MTRRRPSPEELAAKYAPAPRERYAPDTERADRMTAEHHAAADRSGLPGVRRHKGNVLPDGAPERWEFDE